MHCTGGCHTCRAVSQCYGFSGILGLYTLLGVLSWDLWVDSIFKTYYILFIVLGIMPKLARSDLCCFFYDNMGPLPRSCLLKPSAVDKEWFHRGRAMCEVVLGVTAKQVPLEHIVQFIAELICPPSHIIKREWMSESLSGLMCETVGGFFPHGERKSENGLTLCSFSPPSI